MVGRRSGNRKSMKTNVTSIWTKYATRYTSIGNYSDKIYIVKYMFLKEMVAVVSHVSVTNSL
jgi:hypothetical protein